MGCRGVEAYYPMHTRKQTERFLTLARRHKLLVTGGTDFHGGINPDIQIGTGYGSFHVPYTLFDALLPVSSPQSFRVPKTTDL
jgi:hypothetical protein